MSHTNSREVDMKRIGLFHPRVFDDKEWAEGYYKRNVNSIQRMGKRYAELLMNRGFRSGRILDSGCGFGTIPVELAKAFPEVEIIGIDLGQPLLDLARSLAEKAGVGDRITFQMGDVEKLESEDDSFDLVINTFMLHIVENPTVMLNEIERVTKPGGIIMISDLRRIWLGYFMKKFRAVFTLEEAVAIIKQSNLRPGRASTGLFWWDYFVGV